MWCVYSARDSTLGSADNMHVQFLVCAHQAKSEQAQQRPDGDGTNLAAANAVSAVGYTMHALLCCMHALSFGVLRPSAALASVLGCSSISVNS